MAQSKGCNETKEDVMTRSIAASKTGERVFSKKTDSGRVMRLLLHPLGATKRCAPRFLTSSGRNGAEHP